MPSSNYTTFKVTAFWRSCHVVCPVCRWEDGQGLSMIVNSLFSVLPSTTASDVSSLAAYYRTSLPNQFVKSVCDAGSDAADHSESLESRLSRVHTLRLGDCRLNAALAPTWGFCLQVPKICRQVENRAKNRVVWTRHDTVCESYNLHDCRMYWLLHYAEFGVPNKLSTEWIQLFTVLMIMV